jgi:hypothetical protein
VREPALAAADRMEYRFGRDLLLYGSAGRARYVIGACLRLTCKIYWIGRLDVLSWRHIADPDAICRLAEDLGLHQVKFLAG